MKWGVIAVFMFMAGFIVSSLVTGTDIRQPEGTAKDIPSPTLHIQKQDIFYNKEKLTLNIPDLIVAEVDPTTNSMDPWIDNSYLIEKPVEDCDKLSVGDIITYPYEEKRIVHRIIKIENGIIQTKGDNNPTTDPYTVTCNGINRVIGILT